MQTYVAPIALLLTMIVIGVVGMVFVSLLAGIIGGAGIYAGAAAVMLLAALALVLASRAAP